MADRHNRDIDRPRAPLPEPLPVPTVDAHAHMEIVTDAAFDSQEVADVIAEAKSSACMNSRRGLPEPHNVISFLFSRTAS